MALREIYTTLRKDWPMNIGNAGAVRLARLKLIGLPRKRRWRHPSNTRGKTSL